MTSNVNKVLGIEDSNNHNNDKQHESISVNNEIQLPSELNHINNNTFLDNLRSSSHGAEQQQQQQRLDPNTATTTAPITTTITNVDNNSNQQQIYQRQEEIIRNLNSNDDTITISNTESNRQFTSNLADLFAAVPESSISALNAIHVAQHQQSLPQQQYTKPLSLNTNTTTNTNNNNNAPIEQQSKMYNNNVNVNELSPNQYQQHKQYIQTEQQHRPLLPLAHHHSTTPSSSTSSSQLPPRPQHHHSHHSHSRPTHTRDRSVSWSKEPYQYPIISGTNSTNNFNNTHTNNNNNNNNNHGVNIDEINHRWTSMHNGANNNATQIQKRIALEEVLQAGPFESEVETNILKAIDERNAAKHYQMNTQRRKGRTDTGSSSLFSQVIGDGGSLQDFEITSMQDVIDNSINNNIDEQQQQLHDYDVGNNNNSIINNNSFDQEIGSTHHRERADSMTHTVTDRSVRSNSGNNINGGQNNNTTNPIKPILRRGKTNTNSNNNRGHRRLMTVEDTLFNLTNAMSELQNGSDDNGHFVVQHNSTGPLHPPRHKRNASTAIDFAESAALLNNNNEESINKVKTTIHNNDTTKKTYINSTTVNKSTSESNDIVTIPSTEEKINNKLHDINNNVHHSIDPELGNKQELKPTLNECSSIRHETSDTSSDNNINDEDDKNDDSSKSIPSSSRNSRRKGVQDIFKDDFEKWSELFRPQRDRIFWYIKIILCYFLIPLTCIACLLFYIFDNPPTGRQNNDNIDNNELNINIRASSSYIILFCCRQIITFSLSLAIQCIVIDILALNTRILLKLTGPVLTLLIVQSKGWPNILFWWSIIDFCILSGTTKFVQHWLYYQNTINVFNTSNPCGNIVNNEWYIKILITSIILSIVVSIKRFMIGLYLGRQTFSHYGQALALVMNKMLLISEVAGLAKEIEQLSKRGSVSMRLTNSWGDLRGIAFDDDEDDTAGNESTHTHGTNEKVIDTTKRDPLTGSLHYTEKAKLMQLLDQWEEPESRDDRSKNEIASISAVLRFRKALTFIEKRYPFSYAFGPADSREACIEAAQDVYQRLRMYSAEDENVNFETIALLAMDENGDIDQIKAKSLIKLFRPDRQGALTMLDFLKSIDAVYKEFRLLGATIENSSQIDRAFENIFNIIFYVIVATVVVSQFGFNPLTLFLSLSSIILAFAFMIGSASSKYFEGLLFILVRRPYGIGDRIQVGAVETDGNMQGSMPWVVENVTLFETTVRFLPTNERASLSNGSLANSRIINFARSPQAQFHILLQFPLNTPYEKIVVFKSAIEEYMKARPREWRALNGFRATKVVARDNYIEYDIVIQHREGWQELGQILDSKANLSSYCQEVARQLGMHYEAPRVPVDLTYSKSVEPTFDSLTPSDIDTDALTLEFQSWAKNKHQIRSG